MADKQAQIPGGAFFNDTAEATLYQRQIPGFQYVDETQLSSGGGINATLTVTEASDTIVAGATHPILASANITEASDTIVAGATDLVAAVNATFNVSEASDTVLSGTTLPIASGLNVTEASDVLTAGATDQVASINATATITEASDTVLSGATLPISGNATITEASDTYAASMDTGNPAVVISTAGAGKGGKRKLRILPDGNRLYASEEEVRKILETFYRKKTLDDVKLSPPKVQAKFKETPIPDVELVKFDKYVPKLYTLKTEKRMVQADYSLYLKSLKMREEEDKFLSIILEMI